MHTAVPCFLLNSFSKYDSMLLLRLYQISSAYGPHIDGTLGTHESLVLFVFSISSNSLHFLYGYTNTFST